MRYLMRATAATAALMVLTGAHAAPLSTYIAKAELALVDRPQVSLPFIFMAPGYTEAATLELSLGDDAAEVLAESSSAHYSLHVQTRDPSLEVQVRQRTVIYTNLSDDGPHIPLYTTEQRGPWRPVVRLTAHHFWVGGLPEPSLKLSRRKLLDAVVRSGAADVPRWLTLARQCPDAANGPCYTVTDSEYEVSIMQKGQVRARGLLRVRQPDGC